MTSFVPTEFPVENPNEKETKSEPTELTDLDPEAITRTAHLEQIVGKILEQGIFRNPDLIDADIVKRWKDLPNARKNPIDISADEKYAQEVYEILLMEKDETASAITSIKTSLAPTLNGAETDEEILHLYEYALNKAYVELNVALLTKEPSTNEKIDYLEHLFDLPNVNNHNINYMKRALQEIREGKIQYSISNIGSGVKDFLTHEYEMLDISQIPSGSAVYLPQLNAIATVRGAESKDVLVVTTPKRNRYNTGMGGSNATLLIENVIGQCIPLDFEDGIPDSVEERNIVFDELMTTLVERGFSSVETHVFDYTYFADAVLNERFTIPHLGGFQVEQATLVENEIPSFRYVSRDYPYFFFMFDGNALSERYLSDNPKNNFNHYHFIPGGIKFSDEAIIAIVVPTKAREKLLSWIDGFPEEKKKEIFGNRDPKNLFISKAENLNAVETL